MKNNIFSFLLITIIILKFYNSFLFNYKKKIGNKYFFIKKNIDSINRIINNENMNNTFYNFNKFINHNINKLNKNINNVNQTIISINQTISNINQNINVSINNFYSNIKIFNESINKNNYINNEINDNMKITQKIIYLQSKLIINVYQDINNKNNYELNIIDIDKNITNKININDNFKLNDNNEKLNEIINNLKYKDIITISPGGFLGFYDTGTCLVIKNRYNISDCIFIGTSAGSWNSLMMTYKYDTNDLLRNILKFDSFTDKNSLKEIQLILKDTILNLYTEEDFNLQNIFISVCVLENLNYPYFNNYIYTDFHSLKDVIDCCIASSNVPFLTGNLSYYYNGKLSYDGGFIRNNDFIFRKPKLNINYGLWGKKNNIISLLKNINSTMIIKNLQSGIKDTIRNIHILDKIFNN